MRIPPITFERNMQNFKTNRDETLPKYNKINNSADSITFSHRYDKQEAAKKYEKLVKTVSSDIHYREPAVGVDDIKFLLRLNDEDFKEIIMRPVECEGYSDKSSESTIFFYTDGHATKKLLDKLNDKEAAYEILSTKKDWRNTTALHTAAYMGDILKVECICDAVNEDDLKKLMNFEECGDDTPYEVAISSGNLALCKAFKEYW